MADRDPHNFTNGECADKLEEYVRVAKDCDPTPWPRAIVPYIERAVETLRNPPYREFIADADRAPLRRPNGRNDHGDLSLIRGGAGRAAPEVPEGWALVPVEPTAQMLDKGGIWNTEMDTPPEYEALRSIWRDMLAAAPKPTVGGDR